MQKTTSQYISISDNGSTITTNELRLHPQHSPLHLPANLHISIAIQIQSSNTLYNMYQKSRAKHCFTHEKTASNKLNCRGKIAIGTDQLTSTSQSKGNSAC